MQFHWVRFSLLVFVALGLAAGALGATEPDNRIAVGFWIGSGLFTLAALTEVGVWLVRRPGKLEPTPQAIHAPAIESQTKVFSPSIVQADRPGWRAMCEDAGSVGQPHGVVLYIASDRETARDFRCLVRKEGQEPASVQRPGGKVGRHSAHYPKAFPGAPPLSEGEYAFEWFGYVADSPNEMLLASGTFRVNHHLQVFCEEPSDEPKDERMGRVLARLTSDPIATPRSRKSFSPGVLGQPGHEKDWPEQWRFYVDQGSSGVDLTCQKWLTDVPVNVACVVEDPKGERHPGRLHRATDTTARCSYPRDFDVEATPGRHFIHWLAPAQEIGLKGGSATVPMIDPLDFSIVVPDR